MKALVCELCGSNDFVKQDGLFVCQHCGTKYTVEEAKKMMVEGVVEVSGTVKVDNSDTVVNYIKIAQDALDGGNGQSAFDYANKALEIAPTNTDAWILKMKSIEYLGTIGDPRLAEVIAAGNNAIEHANESNIDYVEGEVYSYYLLRALDLLKIAMNKMGEVDDIRQTYQRLLVVSPFSAGDTCLNADKTVVNLYDKVADEAIALAKMVPEEALGKDDGLIHVLEQCALQYQYETDALEKRYKIYGAKLTNSSLNIRNNMVKTLEERVERAKKVRERLKQKEEQERKAEKKAQFEKYWEEHKEEKQLLEDEKSNLEEKLKDLKTQYDSVTLERQRKTDELRRIRDQKVPEELECEKQDEIIRSLEKQRNGLGIFKSKEKKEIQERIDQERIKLEEMEKVAKLAKEKYQLGVNAQINEIKNENQDVIDEYDKIKKRIDEIRNELTKER